jgi:hypothetical protein
VQKFEKTKNTATTVQELFSFPKECRGFHFVVPIITLESLAFSSGFCPRSYRNSFNSKVKKLVILFQ